MDWENTSPKKVEIPFKPARVIIQVSGIILSFLISDNFLPFTLFKTTFFLARILLEYQL